MTQSTTVVERLMSDSVDGWNRNFSSGEVGSETGRIVDSTILNGKVQWGDAWVQFRPFSTGGNYVIFQTADEGDDRIREMYGGIFDRLVEVKTKYDPDTVFRSNRTVSPDALSGSPRP